MQLYCDLDELYGAVRDGITQEIDHAATDEDSAGVEVRSVL